MKRFNLFCFLLAVVVTSYADEVLRVVPFTAQAGTVSDDAAWFDIAMTNSEAIWGFQFEMLLPEGMTLDTTYDPFELDEDRFPYTEDRKHNKLFDHAITWSTLSDGWIRVMVFSADDPNTRVKNNDGVVLHAYYLTDESMPSGLYTVAIRAAKLVITTEKSLLPEPSQSVVAIDGKEDMEVTYTLTDAGWGTLMLPFEAALPAGLSVYGCEQIAGDELVLTSASVIQSNTPYIVTGTVGSYTFSGQPAVEENTVKKGLLCGVNLDTVVAEGYVLQDGDSGTAFYLVDAQEPVTVPTGRCFLTCTQADMSAALRIGGTTGLTLPTIATENSIYDLQGHRCPFPTQGSIVIRDGKKMLNKK